MKKLIFGAVILLMSALTASAQTKNCEVSGRIMEADSGEPAIQANVQLLSLPDSTYIAGNASSTSGYFKLPKVKAGRYLLKVTYVGFKTEMMPLNLKASRNVGTIQLKTDAVMLAEAVITAQAAQVQVVEDTIVFNSSAYRTPEGAMLEELVKKLPGAEVDDDGNIKINGKDIKKIMVNGKEFFGGDVKTGLQNLPVEMIDRLKTYDRQSDEARMSGIDDGEEETVLDLTVKKGMNQGWMINASAAAGTENRYTGRVMVNYFRDHAQFSLIGQGNNVNDRGFSGGGGGPRFRSNNGLTATKMLGANFATESEKLELGGSFRYNYRDNDVFSSGYDENFLLNNSTSFKSSNSVSASTNHNFNANFRLEWRPDTMTTILFIPRASYGKSKSSSKSESGTYEEGFDPYANESINANDYLALEMLQKLDSITDPFYKHRVNVSNNASMSSNNNLSANARLILNRRLNSEGRNIALRLRGSYGDRESESYSQSFTHYYTQQRLDTIMRYNTTPSSNYSLSADLSYSEPIADKTYLQFSYEFEYSVNESDRKAFDMDSLARKTGMYWDIFQPLPAGYLNYEEKDQSKYAKYESFNHEAEVSLRFNREKWRLHAGLSFEPQNTRLSYRREVTMNGVEQMLDTVINRKVFNFSPSLDLRINFSKISQLRLNYRGRSGQPSMENLLPITDDSNPLNITTGNPGLKPSFTHNMSFFYNTYNVDKQRGIMTHLNFSTTQNSISNSRTYISETGGWKSMPKNINGNWNAFGVFGFNTALPNKKYTINSFTNVSYANNVSYQTDDVSKIEQKNTTTNLGLGERLNAAYRNDWFEFGLNGSIHYSIEKDKLTPENNQEPYTFSYGANTQIITPWNMTLTTNIINQARRGYADESFNKDELIWNAQLSQSFLKGAATISLEVYDILKQQSNISRSLTSIGRSVYRYNGVNSYGLLRFTYRLNIFGSKEMREKMQRSMGGFGGPHMGPGHGRGRGRF